ncbi:Galactoside O-acetyltransferase [Planococcus massiliensis]|uniref:Galactoside O-acetyltransferase n=2 Tax=Planococcus massiliensis TaxID=1499687 RepID=A0A098EJQ5_9BACL|nr:Galactoside O-acetyltransferase [Planococcus massiliensis]
MRPFFKSCGKGFKIASGVIINKPEKIVIGKNVYIAHNAWINANGGLNIQDNTIIGPFSVLATSKHKFINGVASNQADSNPIILGEGTWLASHVVITDGVEIGKGCLIASGAVVTSNVEGNTIIGGVPGKAIGKVI